MNKPYYTLYQEFISTIINSLLYVTRCGENGRICTTEIHFLPVRKSYTHALPKYLTIDGQVYFHRWLFADVVEARGWGIIRTAWDTKLLQMTILAHSVDCISSCPILKV